jgi:hypothetical protein
MYNNTKESARTRLTPPSVACITKPMATGGRPTDDPKGTLAALRLAARQVRVLTQRSRREDTGAVGGDSQVHRRVGHGPRTAPHVPDPLQAGGRHSQPQRHSSIGFEPQPDGSLTALMYHKTTKPHV